MKQQNFERNLQDIDISVEHLYVPNILLGRLRLLYKL